MKNTVHKFPVRGFTDKYACTWGASTSVNVIRTIHEIDSQYSIDIEIITDYFNS